MTVTRHEAMRTRRPVFSVPTAAEAVALRRALAFVWGVTGVLVLLPAYRQIGGAYLDDLALPHWLMWGTCALEVGLAVLVTVRPLRTAVVAVQIGAVAVFTVILAALQPGLLVHPLGVLSKNLPFVLCVWAVWSLERDVGGRSGLGVLRFAMAVVWLTEGIVPKLLFQDPWELGLVPRLGLPGEPSLLIGALGVGQALSGVAALVLRGRVLRHLLMLQAAALVALPAFVAIMDPVFLVHPFGPLIKNAPLIVGTCILWRRCSI